MYRMYEVCMMCVCACIISMCMYVHVCLFVCIVCIVCIGPDEHRCQHNVPKRPPAGAAPGGPHSGHPWAGGRPLYSAIGDPPPDPIWRTSAHSTRWGGPKCTPCAAHRQSTRISRSAIPPQAPYEMIWVGSAGQWSGVQQRQHLKNPSRH